MGKPWEKYSDSANTESNVVAKPWEKYSPPIDDKSNRESPSFLASVGRGMMDVAQGAKQAYLELPELGSSILDSSGNKLGIGSQTPENMRSGNTPAKRYTRDVQQEINQYEADKGDGIDYGRLTGNLAATLPTALIPGIGSENLIARTAAAAGGGGIASGVQFVPEGQSRGQNILMGATLGTIIPPALQKATNAANNVIENKAKQKIADFVKSKTLSDSSNIGLKVPPSSVNPSVGNQILEGVSGKIKTEQAASNANKPVINKIAKEYLGVADDVPLTADLLASKRNEYGKAYEAVRGGGDITSDDIFQKALQDISKTNSSASKYFPELAKPEINTLVNALDKKNFDADSAIDVIKILRDNAEKAYRSGDNPLGKANKQAATAMEDLIDRSLTSKGANPSMVNDFRNARQEIAKTYTIQKALNPETGDIDAAKLAKELAKGKPLTGDLKTVAQFATAFPKASQNLKGSSPMISPLDYAAGGLGVASSGSPLALAAVAARPAVRKLLMSDFYQKKFAQIQNDPSALERISPILLDSEAVKKLTPQTLATLFAAPSSGSNSVNVDNPNK